ncbi:VolA/Pla-1 family phospholipase [Shewanella sp. NIFS-20-20]|uniref:VolA/Pla-1 family phospholipase n=1 Tax=Shewanella sp. NIFS-20-20 TaxID=2853806 RepID=UPI001C45D12E|nr:VolA/Pla-1 family phospholipase [Shewanella sp. NIFS-20-20]MBV7315052.1 lipase [Shewanella sp. NIFS-20-20]
MKRLFLGVAIASALGLTGCGGDTYDDLKETAKPLIPVSQIAFDPANAKLPLPNDLLFNGTTDGTLAIPGEASGNYVDPQIALGALDGWSTTSPISITVVPPAGTDTTLDVASVQQPGAVIMYEATVGGPLSSDPECTSAPSVSACKVGAELQFGVDFVSTVSGNTIAIIPLKPLKAKQSYVYAVTSLVQDSNGQSVAPSNTYKLLKLDIDTDPLATPEQLFLQGLVNSYENGIAGAGGVDAETISYAGLFTTQSVADVYETNKLLMASQAPYKPSFKVLPTPAGYTVATALGLTTDDGLAYVVADLADVYMATITLPVYGDCSSVNCLDDNNQPAINGRWQALGDSPVAVLLALQSQTLSAENYATQAIAYGIDPQAALANPSLLAGKTWLLDSGEPADPTKHLTKFNPIVQIKGYEDVPVLITLPNAAKLAAFYSQQGIPFVQPATGWPTTMAMHGLGGGKEMALTYAGTYAANGVATVAIDMPLHGARSFDANGDVANGGSYEVSATDPSFGAVIGQPNAFANGNPLVFVNIASTLSVRDNFRQAVSDHLGVRLALTGLAGALAQAQQPQIFDVNGITTQGLSLGGIVGTSFANYASTGLVDPSTGTVLPNAYELQGASLVAPTGGLAGSFAGSATFGPVLFNTIVATEAFQALVDAANTAGYEPGSDEYNALVQQVYAGFIPSFAFAVQTAVDSADPINQAHSLVSTELPVQLIEIVGDGVNLADQVLPNTVAGFPLSGTEPLVSSLALNCIDSTQEGSGVIRFLKGHHSSIAIPYEIEGVTDGFAAAATVEMQSQAASFAKSAAIGDATTLVNDSSLVKACN